MQIEELDLEMRDYNALRRAEYYTVERLRDMWEEDPEQVKGDLGEKRALKIMEIVDRMAPVTAVVEVEAAPIEEISPSGNQFPEAELAATAYEVDASIKQGAQLAQQGLYQMAQGFKRMRDEKLYISLGYETFEQYCEEETGLKRAQVYNYIGVAENISEKFVYSGRQIGIKKLTLLSKLSPDEQTEIAEKVDLENTTVKQLKKKIAELEEKVAVRMPGQEEQYHYCRELRSRREQLRVMFREFVDMIDYTGGVPAYVDEYQRLMDYIAHDMERMNKYI